MLCGDLMVLLCGGVVLSVIEVPVVGVVPVVPVVSVVPVVVIREVILKKSCFLSDIVQKGGSNPNPTVLG